MPWRICLFSFVFFMFLERETYVFLGGNVRFPIVKVHIKSVWEKNEESLLVVSYFPHFG